MIEIEKSSLGNLERFASGGQAVLFRCPTLTLGNEKGPFVYKEYKPRVAKGRQSAIRTGIRPLLSIRESSPEARRTVDRRSIWPLAVVLPDGGAEGACGIVMRELPPSCFCDVTLLTRSRHMVNEFQFYLQSDDEVQARGLTVLTDTDRWMLLLRAAVFLEFLHSNDVVIGDLSAKNVAIRPVTREGVASYYPVLLDTDGFRIQGTQSHLRQGNTPDWFPPEVTKAEQRLRQLQRSGRADPNEVNRLRAKAAHLGKSTDVYKFGLLINRLLHRGRNTPGDYPPNATSTTVQRSQRAIHAMIYEIGIGRARTTAVIAALKSDPSSRPTMTELVTAMTGRQAP